MKTQAERGHPGPEAAEARDSLSVSQDPELRQQQAPMSMLEHDTNEWQGSQRVGGTQGVASTCPSE